jgi:tRNA(fMet)-specific endonuclease VapC
LSRWALDSHTLSESAKPRPHKAVVRFLEQHGPACAIPAPVWHELWFGCIRLPPSRRRTVLTRWLTTVAQAMEILPYDANAATWHAAERARLVSRGRTPSFTDGMIASIAYTRELTLVTANAADFTSFDGLAIFNWRTNKPVAR